MKKLEDIEKSLNGAYSSNSAVMNALNSELLWMQKKGALPPKKNPEVQDLKENVDSSSKQSDEEEASPPIKKPKRLTIVQIDEQIDLLKKKITNLEKSTFRITERMGRNGNMTAFDASWERFRKDKQVCEEEISKYEQQKKMLMEEQKQQITFLMGFHKRAGIGENGEMSSLLKISQNSIFDKQVLREIFNLCRGF